MVFGVLWIAFCQAAAAAEVGGEAVVGEPFGVGMVELRLTRAEQPEPLGLKGIGLSETRGRALYPAIELPLLGGTVRRAVGRPAGLRVYFLFHGSQPLELSVQARRRYRLRLVPSGDRARFARLLARWWRAYGAAARSRGDRPEPIDSVTNYLQAMLAARLQLELPEPDVDKEEDWENRFRAQLGLEAGNGELLALERQRMLGRDRWGRQANQPLPEPIKPPPIRWPELKDDVEIEPIARRVPAECFYVRFGNFDNFLWFQDRLALWYRTLLALMGSGGVDRQVRRRMEQQLALRQTALARLLGPAAVADVALIGTDMGFAHGAAYGLLFQARAGNPLLGADIVGQRLERLQAGEGVREQKVQLAGRSVSFLSSPDGRVRSFYVADGDFHFVTTSANLAERFIQTGRGEGSLAAAEDFRHARARMPLHRNDTVFVYLSEAMLENLVSPQYRVEWMRRLEARADIELVEMARLAAVAETQPSGSIAQLVRGGFLPEGFGPRSDGSRCVLQREGARDRRRGRRGWFVPVPDVPVDRVSPEEAEAYRRFAEYYHSRWERLDPVIVAIRRTPGPEGRERIAIDAHISPLSKRKLAWFGEALAAPQKTRLKAIPGDLAALEVALAGGRLFAGLRDSDRPLRSFVAGIIPGASWLQVAESYLGTTGGAGGSGGLGGALRPQAEAGPGLSRVGLLWRHRAGPFTVVSFYRDVLEQVVPQLEFVEADRPAQGWLRVGDLSRSRFAAPLNRRAWRRARDECLDHLRWLHTLEQQLRLPPEKCLAVAERLFDAQLVCPLGGDYRCVTGADGHMRWTCTAMPQAGGFPSASGYRSPLVHWLRGLEADMRVVGESLQVHIELDIQVEDATGATLPDSLVSPPPYLLGVDTKNF